MTSQLPEVIELYSEILSTSYVSSSTMNAQPELTSTIADQISISSMLTTDMNSNSFLG